MGWPRKRGGEPGLFVALLRGVVGLRSLWTGGGRNKWYAVLRGRRAEGGGVGRGLPWAFTGLFQPGRGFGAWFVGSCGRGGYRLGLCFGFWLLSRLGLHRRW